MKRILEKEIMDDFEHAVAYANANFDPLFNKYMESFLSFCCGKNFENILDIGCGPALLSIRMAKVFDKAKIYCVDASKAMFEIAQKNIMKHNAGDRIRFIKGLIPDDSLPEIPYDAIISNNFLHHLKDPYALWDTVKKYGTCGTFVFVMDLVRPFSKEEAKNIVKRISGNEPLLMQEDHLKSLMAAFTRREVSSQLKKMGIEKNLIVNDSGPHLMVYGFI